MNNTSSCEIYEKLYSIINCLIVGKGDVKSRLLHKDRYFVELDEENFSEALLPLWLSIRIRLMGYGKYATRNQKLAAVKQNGVQLSLEECSSIASDLHELYIKLQNEYYAR
ncbi:hypothetical protein [Telluribacter sp. SYSU D00476]|uniref:hypothetical protein n=1 Tax=Telluribacter sp. SYSU D00476 TaxID=2811430 RepID=UPI001FF16125|nr:hypothetical protein [Telluribacter sp. SYSU D00476]